MGTDSLGRDVLSRLIFGAREPLLVGFVSVSIGTLAGGLAGLVGGYFGGWTDTVLQRLLEVVMGFPALLLAIVVVAAMGAGLRGQMIAIGIVITPTVARVVRSSAISISEMEYIAAARALGANDRRVMAHHMLPNVLPVTLVFAATQLGNAILAGAGLSFLGLGVPPPAASWGGMVAAATQGYLLLAPWLTVSAGACIVILVLSVNLLGDSLRDLLDPRLRRG